MEDENQQLTKRQRRELKHQSEEAVRARKIRQRRLTNWAIGVLIVAIIGGLAYVVIAARQHTNNLINSGVPTQPVLGSDSAKVTIIEFSDLSCPACATAAPIVQQVATQYGNNVKIVFNEFNLGHEWSEKALEAGECALQQDKFWEYSDLAFSKQTEWASASDAVSKLKSYAQQVGVNTDQFNSCLDSGTMANNVARNTTAAESQGITSTPTFVINGQRYVGVQTLDDFKKIIDAELNKTK